jgi:hypothetical protein
MNFFWIPDPEGKLLLNLGLLGLAPETIRSKNKVGFIFQPTFYVPVPVQ